MNKSIQTIADLEFDKFNARQHTPRNLDMIEHALNEVGAARSIVVDENGRILAGNATVEAAALAGIEKVRVIEADGETIIAVRRAGLTEQQKHRLALYDNRTAELAEWDGAMLAALLSDDEAVVDGLFTGDELAYLVEDALGGDGEGEGGGDTAAQVDKATELQAQWQVEPGQLWQLGEHRVICGDCTDALVWERLLDGIGKANGIFTSPPYAEQRKQEYGGVPTAEYVTWWEVVQANARSYLTADGSFFVNIKPHSESGQRVLYVFDLVLAMDRWGWALIDEFCWVRTALPGMWSNRFKNAFEPIYHFALGNIKFRPKHVLQSFANEQYAQAPTYDEAGNMSYGEGGNRRSKNFDGALPSNVLNINTGVTRQDSGSYHDAYFPVQLPTFFIKAFSDRGDVWIDPFLGSGTTIIAAHNEGRRGLGIERLPKYVAVTLQRFLDHTGIEPVVLS